jgi:hypothetical protein|tara:strand:- start:1837 stop:2109 length:273 start_codon:yes stop_codon:yes gene_type:complete
MDELDYSAKLHVIIALVAAYIRAQQDHRWAEALATRPEYVLRMATNQCNFRVAGTLNFAFHKMQSVPNERISQRLGRRSLNLWVDHPSPL